VAKLKSDSGKRVKRMSITVSENIYGGVRALAALSDKSINDYVFGLLEREVKNNLPAVKKVFEAQQVYQNSLYSISDEGGAGVVEVEVDGEGGDSRQ